ncbi:highly divergent homeobox-like [Stigmatopora argus]
MESSFPSGSGMDSWPQRRGFQTMNLRSVFTLEQQIILERYYDNGMTNQSKACFQLILQCAQETKLDFSVVRTWVGNKRRKLASREDQNGGVSHPLPTHGLAGALLSNHTLGGGGLANHGLSAAALLPSEIAAVRNIHNRVHLLPTSSSFPSFSSSSSSTSSSSPLNSGNNDNDVINTSMYSLNSNPRPWPKPTGPMKSESELSALSPTPLIRQAIQSRTHASASSLHSKQVSSSQNLPSLISPSTSLVYTAARDIKTSLPLRDVGLTAGIEGLPPSWTRPGTSLTQPWSSSHSQTPLQPNSETNLQSPPPGHQKGSLSLTLKNSSSTSEQTPRKQQVFNSAERIEGTKIKDGIGSTLKVKEIQKPVSHSLDTSHNFSIAMETGDEEDEWQREEELSFMAAQNIINQEEATSLVKGSPSLATACSPNVPLNSDSTHQGNYSFTQTSLSMEANSQSSASAATCYISSSRKRTFQDRTQFSDDDIIQLKRYWEMGMTSLASLCREKITAAANHLHVDTEIVKTWISNMRRKYRLMCIEIPLPKGGPAVFTNTSSPRGESPVEFSPEEKCLRTPELGDDPNNRASMCLSEDRTMDSHHRDENGTDVTSAAQLANNVKVEVVDEDVEQGDDQDEVMPLDLEQMQSLLEFKHEEVQFLEMELGNQKQKYLDLVSFTKRLLCAVRNKDMEKQQELIAHLPQPLDQVLDMTKDRGTLPDVVSEDKSSTCHITMTKRNVEHAQKLTNEGPLQMNIKEDNYIKVIEHSASEEQMQGVQQH